MQDLNDYLFDVECLTAIRVQARTRNEAHALILDTIDSSEANLGAWPNGEPIIAECSAHVARCAEVNGDDPAARYGGSGLCRAEINGRPTRAEYVEALKHAIVALVEWRAADRAAYIDQLRRIVDRAER